MSTPNFPRCLIKIFERYDDLTGEEEEVLLRLKSLLTYCSYNELYEMVQAKREKRLKILPCAVGTKVYRIVMVVSKGYPDPKIEPEMFLCDFKEEWADGYGKYIFLESEKSKALEKLAELQKKGENKN